MSLEKPKGQEIDNITSSDRSGSNEHSNGNGNSTSSPTNESVSDSLKVPRNGNGHKKRQPKSVLGPMANNIKEVLEKAGNSSLYSQYDDDNNSEENTDTEPRLKPPRNRKALGSNPLKNRDDKSNLGWIRSTGEKPEQLKISPSLDKLFTPTTNPNTQFEQIQKFIDNKKLERAFNSLSLILDDLSFEDHDNFVLFMEYMLEINNQVIANTDLPGEKKLSLLENIKKSIHGRSISNFYNQIELTNPELYQKLQNIRSTISSDVPTTPLPEIINDPVIIPERDTTELVIDIPHISDHDVQASIETGKFKIDEIIPQYIEKQPTIEDIGEIESVETDIRTKIFKTLILVDNSEVIAQIAQLEADKKTRAELNPLIKSGFWSKVSSFVTTPLKRMTGSGIAEKNFKETLKQKKLEFQDTRLSESDDINDSFNIQPNQEFDENDNELIKEIFGIIIESIITKPNDPDSELIAQVTSSLKRYQISKDLDKKYFKSSNGISSNISSIISEIRESFEAELKNIIQDKDLDDETRSELIEFLSSQIDLGIKTGTKLPEIMNTRPRGTTKWHSRLTAWAETNRFASKVINPLSIGFATNFATRSFIGLSFATASATTFGLPILGGGLTAAVVSFLRANETEKFKVSLEEREKASTGEETEIMIPTTRFDKLFNNTIKSSRQRNKLLIEATARTILEIDFYKRSKNNQDFNGSVDLISFSCPEEKRTFRKELGKYLRAKGIDTSKLSLNNHGVVACSNINSNFVTALNIRLKELSSQIKVFEKNRQNTILTSSTKAAGIGFLAGLVGSSIAKGTQYIYNNAGNIFSGMTERIDDIRHSMNSTLTPLINHTPTPTQIPSISPQPQTVGGSIILDNKSPIMPTPNHTETPLPTHTSTPTRVPANTPVPTPEHNLSDTLLNQKTTPTDLHDWSKYKQEIASKNPNIEIPKISHTLSYADHVSGDYTGTEKLMRYGINTKTGEVQIDISKIIQSAKGETAKDKFVFCLSPKDGQSEPILFNFEPGATKVNIPKDIAEKFFGIQNDGSKYSFIQEKGITQVKGLHVAGIKLDTPKTNIYKVVNLAARIENKVVHTASL